MARTRLAKSVHDAGWSGFVAMLAYKAARYGRTVVRIGRWFPSSRLCSACGRGDGPTPLHIRHWTCPRCGTDHDRDYNAAKNILAAGRAERLNARGADVRPELVPAAGREAGTHRGSRKAAVGIRGLQAGEDVKLTESCR